MNATIHIATVGDKYAPVSALRTVSWEQLKTPLTRHKQGPKEGSGWVPAYIEPGPRVEKRVQSISLLVLDIEGPAEKLPGTEVKRLTGDPAPPVSEAAERLQALGWAGLVVTSWNHEAPAEAGTLGPRYRVTLRVSRPILPDELNLLQEHAAALLGLSACLDRQCFDLNRLFYLPRCPAERQHLAESREVEGQPLDVDGLLGQARAESEAAKKAKASTTPPAHRPPDPSQASVISAFNAARDAGAILEANGYVPRGRNRWIWPGSTTGEPGVVLLPDSGRIYSHHGLDPLHSDEKHAHDTFSVWCILQHGGDVRQAVREAAALLGMKHQPSSPAQDFSALPPQAWPEPTPLPEALPPVQPFDAALLPHSLRPWVADIAERMQVPADFTAVAAVAALSSLIGARAVVCPKAHDDWQVVPNLWGLCVGRPGVMKSPAIGEALKPLQRLEALARDNFEQDAQRWAVERKVSELAAKAREKEAEKLAAKDPEKARSVLMQTGTQPGDEPTQRRFVVNDCTVEALGTILAANPWGSLAYRDELYGLLQSLDRQGQEGSRAFMLQAFDGDKGYTFDRIMRGQTHCPRVCLSMLGGIQPGRVQEYVRGAVTGGAGDDGLLQRFGLAVWPDVSPEFDYVDRFGDTPARQAAWAVFERLAELQPDVDGEPAVWRFDAHAQALFAQWYTESRRELKAGELHPALESHLSKYAKLVPALALIFALVDTPSSHCVIGQAELMRALAWAEYLRTHAERLYSAAVTPETGAARTLLQGLAAGRLADGDGVMPEAFTPREVAVKHWAGLTTPEEVRRAAEVLCAYDWLRQDTKTAGQAGGRPSERYLISPAVLAGRGQR